MKIALTVWDDRISPVFDSARMLLIAEIREKEVVSRQYQPFDPDIPMQLTDMLKGWDISVVICGAISELPADRLEAAGIQLIPFISGNVDEILEKYSKGEPFIQEHLMPGCGGKRDKKCLKGQKKQRKDRAHAMNAHGGGCGKDRVKFHA